MAKSPKKKKQSSQYPVVVNPDLKAPSGGQDGDLAESIRRKFASESFTRRSFESVLQSLTKRGI